MNMENFALGRLGDVQVNLSVELGRTELTLKDVLALQQGSVVALNRLTDELLDVTANGKPIARAEVVAQNGRFALRVVELVGDESEPSAPAAWPPADAPNPMGAHADAPMPSSMNAPTGAPQAAPQAPPPPPSGGLPNDDPAS